MKKKSKRRFLQKYDGKKYDWFLTARDSVVILLGVFLLFNLLVGVSRVQGSSMAPTLTDGDIVFFTRLNFGYEQGEVVFAKMPSGSFYVKRILACEGDVVDLRDGALYINGIQEAGSYLNGETKAQPGIVEYPYTVGPGMLFMVGDNRAVSEDSRSFGALPESSIQGKLIFVD